MNHRTGPLAIALLVMCGCRTHPAPKVEAPDPSDVLINHLVSRIAESDKKISDLGIEVQLQRGKCLDEQIAALQGHPVHHKIDSLAEAKAMGKDLEESTGRLIDYMLDDDAAIEDHNRRHPERPWALPKLGLSEICGDCAPERAARALRMKREASELDKNHKEKP